MDSMGKELLYLFMMIYAFVHSLLWYNGKLKLSPYKESLRKERLDKWGYEIKALISFLGIGIVVIGIIIFKKI